MGALLARIAVLLRPVIQFAITWIAIDVFARYIAPHLDDIITNIQIKFGVDPQTAQDIAANEYLHMAEQIGVGALTIKSRTPSIVADKLGFTTRGYAKRPLPAQTEAKVATARGDLKAAASATQEVIATQSKTLSLRKGVSLAQIQAVASLIIAGVGVPVGVGLLITNTIDFGAWSSSAYQGQFQRFLGFFGLTPDRPTTTPRTVSQDVFLKVYVSLKNEGATQIRNPYTGETVAYTEANFSAVVDKLASHIFIETGTVSAKQLLAASLAVVDLQGTSASTRVPSPTSTGATASASASSSIPQIKLFTGVVADGTLGTPQEFVARSNSMIDSDDEMKAAAKINLAAFVQSLPGRFYYELSVVNSVKTRAGNTQKGEPVKIISGYNKNGTPRYKTVYYKFAVLKLGVTDENGKTQKLGTINLGPVNIVDYQPSAGNLKVVENSISPELFTNNIAEVKQVITPQPLAVSADYVAPTPAPAAAAAPSVTDAQLYAREHPTPFEVPIPPRGSTFRFAGDAASVYTNVDGLLQPSADAAAKIVPNTDLRMANGQILRKGEAYDAGLAGYGGRDIIATVDPSYYGLWWYNITAAAGYDLKLGSGAFSRLPMYNRADLQSVSDREGGRLPNVTSVTLNA